MDEGEALNHLLENGARLRLLCRTEGGRLGRFAQSLSGQEVLERLVVVQLHLNVQCVVRNGLLLLLLLLLYVLLVVFVVANGFGGLSLRVIVLLALDPS